MEKVRWADREKTEYFMEFKEKKHSKYSKRKGRILFPAARYSRKDIK
jgi:hypothetical protein